VKKEALFILCSLVLNSFGQNCARISTGYPPINDLGTGLWKNVQGGLYPSGLNTRPTAHNNAGLLIASRIQPLDSTGKVDSTQGKIVMLSIGMSNTTMEFQVFLPMTDTFSAKNPNLVCVDGAQGGQAIVQILPPNANFWTVIQTRLTALGLTSEQVQVVWFKQAEMNPTDSSFPGYPDSLKEKFKSAMKLLKVKYPNLALCYLSNRIYGGYATGTLNPEPYAYYCGWAVKRLIEDQISGDTGLVYSGPNVRSPWLSWGPYLWADGTTPRSDGLTWICPADFNTDGTHPSVPGRQKVAGMLLDFFSKDETAMPWFLKKSSGTENHGNAEQLAFAAFPNPWTMPARISFEVPASMRSSVTLELLDLQGRKVRTIFQGGTTGGCRGVMFDGQDAKGRRLENGVYLCRLILGERTLSKKIVVLK
jgi:hypothetical protein